QQNDRLRRVDVVFGEALYEGRIAALTEALRGLGWIDGRNLNLAAHPPKTDAADIRRLVTEVLSARPDVVVSAGAAVTGPLLEVTRSVPVVFTSVVDPVGAGFVESLAQPGGNATGFMQFDFSLSGKWLELLKQVAPATTRAGVIRDPGIPSGVGQFAVIQSIASSVGIDVVPISPRDAADLESGVVDRAFAKCGPHRNRGWCSDRASRSDPQTGRAAPVADRLREPAVRGPWWPYFLRTEPHRIRAARCGVCGSHPQGRETGRSPGSGT